MDAGTRPAVEAEDERPRKTARVVSPEALAALEVENTTIQADLNAMRGEVTLLRRQVLLLSRTPPSAESSIAVVSRLLHGELQAAIKKERGNRERLSVDNLAAYSASEWLESLTGVMPTLRAVILAMGLPWGRVEEGGEPNTNNRVKRLVAVTSAVSSLMHSLNLNFCSVLGHLQSFSVYSITGSPAAVQAAAIGGNGAPRVAPQHALFAKTAALVETNTVCFAPNTDLKTYFDNVQNQGLKTSATGSEYQYKIKVGTHMMCFHLLTKGDLKNLVQQRHDCMPARWRSWSQLNPEFGSIEVGRRQAWRDFFVRGRWSQILVAEQAKRVARAAAVAEAEAETAVARALPALPLSGGMASTPFSALLAEEGDEGGEVDGGGDTTAASHAVGAGLTKTVYPKPPPRRDGKEASTSSVQAALPWPTDVRDDVPAGRHSAGDTPPISYKPNPQSVDPVDANPGLNANIKPIMELMLQHAQVSGYVTPEQQNRLWTWIGMDGAGTLEALKQTEEDPTLGAVCAVFSALGHEHWAVLKGVLRLVQPLLGEHLLHLHSGSKPSANYKNAIRAFGDTHKASRFIELLQDVVMGDMCRRMLEDTDTAMPPPSARTYDDFVAWQERKREMDATLSLWFDLTTVMLDAQLFFNAMRWNEYEGIEAARAGSLTAFCFGNGNRNYAQIMTLFGAMYGPGDNGRAPTRVRESFTQNMAKGKSGKLGQLQAIDVLQEETIREVVRAGHGTTQRNCIGRSLTVDTASKLRPVFLAQGGKKERPLKPRSRLVLEEDMANMAAQLYSSDYFKPVEGRGVVDFEGNKMEANAHLLLEVGRERKAEYEKDYVLTGMWQKYVFPARVPVIPKNKATGSDDDEGSDDDDEGTSYDSSDDGSDEEGREWVPLEKR